MNARGPVPGPSETDRATLQRGLWQRQPFVSPAIPRGVYVPPQYPEQQAPPLPADNQAPDYEVEPVTTKLPASGQELLVYTTKKRWRAIDVYFDTNGFPGGMHPLGDVVSVRVYAIAGSTRTLVASGKINEVGSFPYFPSPQWVIAHRGLAQRFEVTVTCNFVPTDHEVTITTMASDEAVEPPELVGTVPYTLYLTTPIIGWTLLGSDEAELVGLNAVTDAGAARWLLVFDRVPIPGTLPLLSFPISPSEMLFVDEALLRVTRRPEWYAAGSSTPGGYTAVADVFAQMWIR